METVEQIKGAKYDDGKLRLSLVPPEIVTAVAEVREFGKRKYADAEDWRSVPREKWQEALLRHVLAMWNNPLAIDEESGLPALWHVATNVAFLCAAYKIELQDKQIEWAQRKVSCLKEACEQEAAEDFLRSPDLVCTEEDCYCFEVQCKNNCARYFDVRDCKQINPEESEAQP